MNYRGLWGVERGCDDMLWPHNCFLHDDVIYIYMATAYGHTSHLFCIKMSYGRTALFCRAKYAFCILFLHTWLCYPSPSFSFTLQVSSVPSLLLCDPPCTPFIPFFPLFLFIPPPPNSNYMLHHPFVLQPYWLFLSVTLLFRVWDVLSGTCKRTLKGQACSYWCDTLALTPDGAHLVSGSGDGTIMWVIACVLAHQSKEVSEVFVMW